MGKELSRQFTYIALEEGEKFGYLIFIQKYFGTLKIPGFSGSFNFLGVYSILHKRKGLIQGFILSNKDICFAKSVLGLKDIVIFFCVQKLKLPSAKINDNFSLHSTEVDKLYRNGYYFNSNYG